VRRRWQLYRPNPAKAVETPSLGQVHQHRFELGGRHRRDGTGSIHAFNMTTGRLLWFYPVNFIDTSFSREMIFVLGGYDVVALDPGGVVQWTFSIGY
jgi:outer membrane protein assembly factor BamB